MIPTTVPVNVLLPAIVWAVVKSTKFWVAEPVPPFAIGKTPLYPVAIVDGVAQLVAPAPSVVNTCPFVPTLFR